MKVLIVNDSPQAIAVAKAAPGKREAGDILRPDCGQAGLDAAKHQKPDLILLDLDMPDMSGFEVCKALKADHELYAIPVIFLSASGTTEDKVKGLDLGAVDYISKPFDAFELRARVRAALRAKRMQDLLAQYAQIDPLTELMNRRALMERLAQEWARIRRNGRTLAVIMADLDRFKSVNDTHGHTVGDQVLCEVAKAIAAQCRQSDLPARYGGEEFIVLVTDTDTDGAALLAERCRQSVANLAVSVQDGSVTVTASFGVADSAAATSWQEVVAKADEAMYEAKRAGRDRVVVANRAAALAESS